MLSKAGKEILVKAVAQAIPTYAMSCFDITKTLCDELSAMVSRYWWSQQDKKHKIHWLSWEKLTISKKKGGLRFRDLHLFNLAMLARQAWWLLTNPDSLYGKVLKSKYFPRTSILQSQAKKGISYFWRSILQGVELMKKALIWRVGDGSNIKIWADPWILRGETRRPATPRGTSLLTRVDELMDPINGGWDEQLVRDTFWEEDAETILAIPVGIETPDWPAWHFDSKGMFSVKSAYKIAVQARDSKAGRTAEASSGSGTADVQFPWRKIWQMRLPNKGIQPHQSSSQATHDTPHRHTPRGRAGIGTSSQSLPAFGRTALPPHAVCCRPQHESPAGTPLLDPHRRRLFLTNPASTRPHPSVHSRVTYIGLVDNMSSSNQMCSDGKFGRGPRELSGAVDLISRYKLLNHHSFFCKKPLPLAISDTNYLNNVVGDTEIRKGEGMELDQLFQNSYSSEKTAYIQPFDMETLGQAFQLRETAPVDLPSAEKGTPTISGKSKVKSKDKVKKHKKHKEKDRDKEKEQKKHKHRHKDRSKDKDKDKDKDKEKKKDKSGNHDSGGDHSKKHEKKRKQEVTGSSANVQNHKKTQKHKNQ